MLNGEITNSKSQLLRKFYMMYFSNVKIIANNFFFFSRNYVTMKIHACEMFKVLIVICKHGNWKVFNAVADLEGGVSSEIWDSKMANLFDLGIPSPFLGSKILNPLLQHLPCYVAFTDIPWNFNESNILVRSFNMKPLLG
jgi:hypothetical protein